VQLKKGGKSPVIRHNSSAEFVRILHGEVIIYLDGEQMSGIPGTTIYIPPQVPHGFKAVSESSTILVVHVPGVSPTSDHTVIYEDIDMVPR
jgi:quercetin dioxygenase-like cupin family protein